MQNVCKCGQPVRSMGQRYCRPCHAANMREYRARTPLTPEQRVKDTARSYAGVYRRRGKLQPQPCEHSGCTEKPEMHHDDYSRPLDVRWLCRKHHLELHDNTETGERHE